MALIVTIGYIILTPYFFHLFFPKYLEAIAYAQVFGLTILFTPGMWLGQTMIAHMRKWELYVVNTINPIVKMALYVGLIPFFGIWGAIGAVLGSNLLGLLLGIWVFRRL